jgi:hypothetical protein
MKKVIFVVQQMAIPSNFGQSFINCCEKKRQNQLGRVRFDFFCCKWNKIFVALQDEV